MSMMGTVGNAADFFLMVPSDLNPAVAAELANEIEVWQRISSLSVNWLHAIHFGRD